MSNYSNSFFDEANSNTSWYKAFHLIPKNSKVLDVGCSSGNFGEALISSRGCQVDGIEIAPDDLIESRKKLGQVYELNIESDSLKSITGKYDIIYFGDVIEHLIDPVKALQKIKPLFSENGKLVFSIPNMAHIGVRLELLRGHFDYTETGLLDKTHLHYHDRAELERVLSGAGYVLEKLDYVAKDYPRELIVSELNEMGLTASDKFLKLMAQPEAAAFQWIGMASPTLNVGTAPKRAQFGPVDHFENLLHRIEEKQEKQNAEAQETIAWLQSENERMRLTIESIKNNPVKYGLSWAKNKVKKQPKK